MNDKDKLAELAKRAASVTPERRRELEARLEFGVNPRHNTGLVFGLAQAATVMSRWPDAARELHEIAGVAAGYVLEELKKYEWMDQQLTPEVRAEMNDEIARIARGEVEMVSAKQILEDMKEAERLWREQHGKDNRVA